MGLHFSLKKLLSQSGETARIYLYNIHLTMPLHNKESWRPDLKKSESRCRGLPLLMTRKTCRQHSSSFSLSELVRRLGYNKLSWQRMLHDKGELLLIILIYLCKWLSWLPQTLDVFNSLTSFTQLTSVHSGTQTLFICSKNIPLNYVGPKISLQIHSELFSRQQWSTCSNKLTSKQQNDPRIPTQRSSIGCSLSK